MLTRVGKDIQIIRKAIENENYLGVATAKKGLKITVYSIFICIVNKYKTDIGKNILIVNGKAELKFDNQINYNTLYYAVVSSDFFSYHNLLTHVSCLRRSERVKVFFEAIKIVKTDRKIKFGYALDYLLWKKFLACSKIQCLCVLGHYDRLTTQISFLAEDKNIDFSIKQHGLIGEFIKIPYKLPIKSMSVFDENELRKFKNNVVMNSDCRFTIEYISKVNFTYTDSDKKIIGIIEQPIKEMQDIIDEVKKKHFNDEIHLMLHPLSNVDYSKYIDDNFIIDRTKKEWNCECIYSGPSTLVYDYLRTGFKGKMLVCDMFSVLCGLDKYYNNLFLVDNWNDFREKIG